MKGICLHVTRGDVVGNLKVVRRDMSIDGGLVASKGSRAGQPYINLDRDISDVFEGRILSHCRTRESKIIQSRWSSRVSLVRRIFRVPFNLSRGFRGGMGCGSSMRHLG